MPDATLGAKVTNMNETSPWASKFSKQMQTVINDYKLIHEKTELVQMLWEWVGAQEMLQEKKRQQKIDQRLKG